MKNVFLTNSNSTPMIKTSNYSVQSISNNTIKKNIRIIKMIIIIFIIIIIKVLMN